MEDKTADELIEGTSNKYYKKEYFDNDLNNYLINREQNNDVITLDNIQQGTINKSIENGFYKGTLTVDNIIVNNYIFCPCNKMFNVEIIVIIFCSSFY